MISKKLSIVFTVLLITGCSSNSKNHSNVETKPIVNTQEIFLAPVVFNDQDMSSKVKSECSMLENFQTAILSNGARKKINLKYKSDITPQSNETFIKVEFIDVVSHRLSFMSFRPSSVATFSTKIYQNGQLLDSTTKSISSGAALGACDRLEKISLAAGKYVTKWLSTKI